MERPQVVLSAYTKILICGIGELQTYVEKILGRPVWTHEFGNAELWLEIRAAINANGDLKRAMAEMDKIWPMA